MPTFQKLVFWIWQLFCELANFFLKMPTLLPENDNILHEHDQFFIIFAKIASQMTNNFLNLVTFSVKLPTFWSENDNFSAENAKKIIKCKVVIFSGNEFSKPQLMTEQILEAHILYHCFYDQYKTYKDVDLLMSKLKFWYRSF